jgi:hypothetical protein
VYHEDVDTVVDAAVDPLLAAAAFLAVANNVGGPKPVSVSIRGQQRKIHRSSCTSISKNAVNKMKIEICVT